MKSAFQFLVAAVLLVPSGPALAEKLSLAAISDYLNGMRTAEAPFTQINDDGTIATGRFYLRRPGAMRFEYDPPERSLVIAGKGQVAIFDPKSNEPPERFPLVKTPLYLILKPEVDLGQARMVVAHVEDGPSTVVTAQDPEHPDYGNIQLVFTANPVELRQWIVTDGSGQTTTVVLGGLKTGMSFMPTLFDIEHEIEERGF